jgi:hypothetical protein
MKWAMLTYNGKETRTITKLFKEIQRKIAFRTQITIQNILKQHPRKYKHNESGIYKMKCLDCPLKYSYLGQTDREFHTKYENICKQLEITAATHDTRTIY